MAMFCHSNRKVSVLMWLWVTFRGVSWSPSGDGVTGGCEIPGMRSGN